MRLEETNSLTQQTIKIEPASEILTGNLQLPTTEMKIKNVNRNPNISPSKSCIATISTPKAMITISKTKPLRVLDSVPGKSILKPKLLNDGCGYESAFLSFINSATKSTNVTNKRKLVYKKQLKEETITKQEPLDKPKNDEKNQENKERKARKNANPKNLKDISRLSVQDASNTMRSYSVAPTTSNNTLQAFSVAPQSDNASETFSVAPNVFAMKNNGLQTVSEVPQAATSSVMQNKPLQVASVPPQASHMPVLTKPDTTPFVEHEKMPVLDPPCVQPKYVFKQQNPAQEMYSIASADQTQAFEMFTVENPASIQTFVTETVPQTFVPTQVAYEYENVQNNVVYAQNVLQTPVYVQNVVQPPIETVYTVEEAPQVEKKVRKPNMIWANHKYYTVNTCETEYENKNRFYPMSMQPITLQSEGKTAETNAETDHNSSHILEESTCCNQENIDNNKCNETIVNDKQSKSQSMQYYAADIENYPKIYEKMTQQLEDELSNVKLEIDEDTFDAFQKKLAESDAATLSNIMPKRRRGRPPKISKNKQYEVKKKQPQSTELSEQVKSQMRLLTPMEVKLKLDDVMRHLNIEQRGSLMKGEPCVIQRVVSSCLVGDLEDGRVKTEVPEEMALELPQNRTPGAKKVSFVFVF